MADHALVEWTLETIASNYTPGNVDTSTPVLKDGDDGTVYTIDVDQGTLTQEGRKYAPDLANTNVVTVDPDPGRQDEPIGTEYDLRVTDAVGIAIEGLHVEEGGEVTDGQAFQTLIDEVRRAVLIGRTSYPTVGAVDYHTVRPANSGRPPENQQSNLFAYSWDVEFAGYEELP